MAERWLPVPGFPRYEVSDEGRVRNARTGHVLAQATRSRGYKTVSLYHLGRDYRRSVHRLVLLAFVGPPPTRARQTAHADGDPGNNCVANLRWASPKQNAADRRRHGRHPEGGKNPRAKLTADQVAEIRRRWSEEREQWTHQKLAAAFGCSRFNIDAILRGRSWAVLDKRKYRQKLTDEDVRHLRRVQAAEGLTVRETARRYGISPSHAAKIIKGEVRAQAATSTASTSRKDGETNGGNRQ